MYLLNFERRIMGQDRLRLQKKKKSILKDRGSLWDGCEKREKVERALTLDTVIQSLKLA